MLTPDEIDALVRRIVARLRPRKVIVFGSYAKGTATARSDLDLFVIQETDLPRAKRADDVRPIIANVLIPVDVLVYTPEEVEAHEGREFSFVRSVLQTGRTVFEL